MTGDQQESGASRVLTMFYFLIWVLVIQVCSFISCTLFSMYVETLKKPFRDFPGGAVVKNVPANAEDTGSIPGPGRSHMSRSN